MLSGGDMERVDRRDQGAAAVEFALVLPVLILVLFGIIEFGIAFAQELSLNAGAREGARLGVVPGTDCAGVTAATQSAAATISLPGSNVVVTVGSGCSGSSAPCTVRGDPLVVTAATNFTINIPVWGTQTVTLTGKGEYRCETGTA
ncbi:MAG: hypothetical protein NVS3B26_10220 [Mycobacteriales bacterium]